MVMLSVPALRSMSQDFDERRYAVAASAPFISTVGAGSLPSSRSDPRPPYSTNSQHLSQSAADLGLQITSMHQDLRTSIEAVSSSLSAHQHQSESSQQSRLDQVLVLCSKFTISLDQIMSQLQLQGAHISALQPLKLPQMLTVSTQTALHPLESPSGNPPLGIESPRPSKRDKCCVQGHDAASEKRQKVQQELPLDDRVMPETRSRNPPLASPVLQSDLKGSSSIANAESSAAQIKQRIKVKEVGSLSTEEDKADAKSSGSRLIDSLQSSAWIVKGGTMGHTSKGSVRASQPSFHAPSEGVRQPSSILPVALPEQQHLQQRENIVTPSSLPASSKAAELPRTLVSHLLDTGESDKRCETFHGVGKKN
jgi:hypothetical protein